MLDVRFDVVAVAPYPNDGNGGHGADGARVQVNDAAVPELRGRQSARGRDSVGDVRVVQVGVEGQTAVNAVRLIGVAEIERIQRRNPGKQLALSTDGFALLAVVLKLEVGCQVGLALQGVFAVSQHVDVLSLGKQIDIVVLAVAVVGQQVDIADAVAVAVGRAAGVGIAGFAPVAPAAIRAARRVVDTAVGAARDNGA